MKGAGVALVTPFKEDLEIDFDGLKNLLDHVSDSIDYLVVLGTTGEASTLSPDEKKKLIEFIIKNNSRNLPLVLGIGGNNTKAVLSEIENTDIKSFDALLSVSPYYNKPSQRGIKAHYTAIADASPVPVILYNVPGRTGSNISAETTLALAKHQNIMGVKEASGDMEQAITIAKNKPRDFQLISGDDLLTLPLLSIGATGVISVLANVYPEAFQNMVKYFHRGDHTKAADEVYNILDINHLMYREGNPVGVKEALRQKGVCSGVVRLPLYNASDELTQAISNLLV